jgi:hypothetical protein
MHPILVTGDSLPTKVVVAVISIVALFFFVRAYLRNGRL